MVIDELVAVLGFDVKGEEKLRSFNMAIEQTAARIAAVAAAAGIAAAAGLAALGKSVIETTAKFEQYEATLTTIEGSSEKAKKSLDWVAQFAKTTPYEVGDVTQAFVRLKAYGLDPLDGSLKAAGDAGSAMGVGLMSGVEAIADAMTGENERLKAFGITTSVAGDKITYSWQENGKTLNKTLKKNGADIAKFLEENFERRFGGAMERQSKTWNGMVSNLADSWTDFQRRIGNAGFFDNMKGKLGQLTDYIARLDKNGTLDRWARSLSNALSNAADGIGYVVSRIARHLEAAAEFYDKHKEKLEGLKWAFLALAAYLFPVASMFVAAGIALEDFLTYLEGGDSAIGKFIEALAKFMGADPQQVAQVIGSIAAEAAKLAAVAVGVGLFAGSLSKVAGALGLLGTEGAASGLKNLAKAGASGSKISGPKVGLLSMLGLESVIEMGSGTLQEGKARGDSWNKWLEQNVGSPSGYLKRVFGGGSGNKSPNIDYGALSRDRTAHGAALDGSIADQLRNASGNFGRMSGGGAAQAMNSTVNDNRNQAVNVNVGGVTVNGVQNVSGAVGAAVGSAVGNGAAGGAKRATWHEAGDKI